MSELKLLYHDTCKWYDVAPVEVVQVKVADRETPVAPFAGESSTGIGGAPGGLGGKSCEPPACVEEEEDALSVRVPLWFTLTQYPPPG